METPMPLTIAAASTLWGRVAALLEVVGVFVAGHTTASYLTEFLGIRLGRLVGLVLKEPNPDLIPLSMALLEVLALEYTCLLSLAFGIGWWHRRRSPHRYGLTMAGQSLWSHVLLGLLAFSLVVLPLKVLWFAHQFTPFAPGSGSVWWEFLAKGWTTSFWLLFAVIGYVVVPIGEELFFRGYCQSRLEEEFGGVGAVIIAALFFVFVHGQYQQPNVMSIGMMFCLIPTALGLGYVYWRTRSLIPSIVLHAALNFPTKGIYDILVPAVMLLTLVLFRRRLMSMAKDCYRQVANLDAKATLCAGSFVVVVAVGFQRWPGLFLPLASSFLVIALLLEHRERRFVRSIRLPCPGKIVT